MARAVSRGILEAYPEADFSLSVVWIDILATDERAEAITSADILVDPRVRHFHDPNRRMGLALAPHTGLHSMPQILERLGQDPKELEGSFNATYLRSPATLFDVVFFYDAKARWIEQPPAPSEWVTQLDPDLYTGYDRERFRWGDELIDELRRLAGLILEDAEADDVPSPAPAKREDGE